MIPRPGCAASGLQPLAHGFHQFEARAAQPGRQPKINPMIMTPASAAVLASVKLFCTSLPMRKPRVFVNVRSAISKIAMSCSVERLSA